MFAIGDSVYRLDSGLHGATVIDISESSFGRSYHITYEEGGDGWWSESALFATAEEQHVAEAPSLAAAKVRKLAELAERRWRAEIGGITIGALPVATDAAAQAKLTGAVVASLLDNAYSVRWKLADGTFALLDHETLITAAQSVRAHVQGCFDHEAVLADQINAASDTTQLAACDLDSGWPS